MLRRTDWTSLKQIRSDNGNLTFHYQSQGTHYIVLVGERQQIYWSLLTDPSEVTDFENNYKSGGVATVSFDDALSKIMLLQDTNEEIVTAINNIGVSVALAQYRPKFYLASSGFPAINETTDTAILDLSFTGKVNSIMVRFDRDDVELALEIDGQEKGRFKLDDFKGAGPFNLESSNKDSFFPIQVSDTGKQITIQWTNMAPDVTSSLKLLAKETSGFDTDVVSILISYAEKV